MSKTFSRAFTGDPDSFLFGKNKCFNKDKRISNYLTPVPSAAPPATANNNAETPNITSIPASPTTPVVAIGTP